MVFSPTESCFSWSSHPTQQVDLSFFDVYFFLWKTVSTIFQSLSFFAQFPPRHHTFWAFNPDKAHIKNFVIMYESWKVTRTGGVRWRVREMIRAEFGKCWGMSMGDGRWRIWEMMQATTLGNLFRRAGNQRTCFWVTSSGRIKATKMGTVFLLVFSGCCAWVF